jgi:hypothetical protein
MKITLDLLKKCGACGDGYEWSVQTFPAGEETFQKGREKLVQYLKTSSSQTITSWLTWYDSLLTNPIAIKYYNDWFYTEKYSFVNRTNNVLKEYNSKEEMLVAFEIVKTIVMQEYLDKMSINEHISNEDGTVTWVPVDIKTLTDEAEYQVFNPMLGTHKYCATLQDAKTEILSIQESFANSMLTKQEQISNPDGDCAWVTI